MVCVCVYVWDVLSVFVDKCVFQYGVQPCATCMTISGGQQAFFLSHLGNNAKLDVCIGVRAVDARVHVSRTYCKTLSTQGDPRRAFNGHTKSFLFL